MNRCYIAVLLTCFSAGCQEPVPEKKPATTSESATPSSSHRKTEDDNGMRSVAPSASANASAARQSALDLAAELNSPGGLWGDEGDSRHSKPPSVRMGATSVTGKLPPEVIQRVMRQNFGKLRQCLSDALVKDPLQFGRITTSFIIDATGASKGAKSTGDIKDKEMIACVEKVFGGVQFPAPESGVVKVIYPVAFAAPPYAFTIGDKPSALVQEADLVKALEAAGYKVTGAATASHPSGTVSRFKAEKSGVTFAITLDPAAKLPIETYKKLKKEAVLLQDGAWCLFVASSDKTASQALVDAIHKKLAAK